MIPLIHCQYRNIVNFPCISQIHFYFKNTLKNATQTNGGVKPQNFHSPWGIRTPSNTQMTRMTPFITPNANSIGLRTFAHLCHKLPIGHNKMPHIQPKNYPFLWGKCQSQLYASSLHPADQPNQTTSRSNQPFFHSPPERPTYRQTDQLTRWSRQQNLYKHPLTLY